MTAAANIRPLDAVHRRSPFGATMPAIVAALVFGATAVIWVVAGSALPGGRWLSVHLFTLGVLTNLVLAFSEHFARTLTRSRGRSTVGTACAANVAIVLTLVGLPNGIRWLTALGAGGMMSVVLASWWRLRRMRKESVGARFAWVVRVHERAHGAFVHGGLLGLLLAIGAFKGGWYASARLAHLHINLLGWGGLMLLATLVFFGPTMARTRIVPGSDDRAAVALRHGATGLTLGVFALLATGAGGAPSTLFRLLAAAGLGTFAWSVSVVCLPVARAALRGNDESARWPLIALCSWFQVVVWGDVVVTATGAWKHLDALGLALVLGVLAQAVLATLVYVWPMLRNRPIGTRSSGTAPAISRAATWNLSVMAIVAGSIGTGPLGAWSTRIGWSMLLAVLAWTVLALLAPPCVRRGRDPANA